MKVSLPADMPNQAAREEEENVGDAESMKLPAALEQALAFKNERAKEVGADPNDISVPGTSPPRETLGDDGPIEFVISTMTTNETEKVDSKASKGKKKKKKKRKKHADNSKESEKKTDEPEVASSKEDMPEVEYVQEIPGVADLEPMYRQFARVFEAFKLVEPDSRGFDGADKGEAIGQYPPAATPTAVPNKAPLLDDFDDDVGQPTNAQVLLQNNRFIEIANATEHKTRYVNTHYILCHRM